jgi:hypothetical protein
MSDLSEADVFQTLVDNLKQAIQAADDLTTLDRRGPAYHNLREALRVIEGCCRQASAFREDTRWLPLGMLAHECHQKAGKWLRGDKNLYTGVRTPIALREKNELFAMLAMNLRNFLKGVESLKDSKTGRVGMILPEEKPHDKPKSRISMNGLILPHQPTETKAARLILPPSATIQ